MEMFNPENIKETFLFILHTGITIGFITFACRIIAKIISDILNIRDEKNLKKKSDVGFPDKTPKGGDGEK